MLSNFNFFDLNKFVVNPRRKSISYFPAVHNSCILKDNQIESIWTKDRSRTVRY